MVRTAEQLTTQLECAFALAIGAHGQVTGTKRWSPYVLLL